MNYPFLKSQQDIELGSPTLHGTTISLDARSLIREILVMGTLKAHNNMKSRFGFGTKGALRMEEIWAEAFDKGYCIRRCGRIEITEKGRDI